MYVREVCMLVRMLVQVVKEVVDLDQVRLQDRLQNLGVDSLMSLELRNALAAEFTGVPATLDAEMSVGELCRNLAPKTGGSASAQPAVNVQSNSTEHKNARYPAVSSTSTAVMEYNEAAYVQEMEYVRNFAQLATSFMVIFAHWSQDQTLLICKMNIEMPLMFFVSAMMSRRFLRHDLKGVFITLFFSGVLVLLLK